MANRLSALLVMLAVLVSPSFAQVELKDAVTLNPIPSAHYEAYAFPELDLLATGITDANGTLASTNSTRWIIFQSDRYDTVVVEVLGNQSVYMVKTEEHLVEIDAECGIICNDQKVVTKSCSCVCTTSCPPSSIQNEDCRCVFPLLFSPLHMNSTELYSQYIVATRVAEYEVTGVSLIEEASGCSVTASDMGGRLIKTNPCRGGEDGEVICAFAVDDSFIVFETYNVQLKCATTEKNFNVTVTAPSNSKVYNFMRMYVASIDQIAGLFIAIIIGYLFIKGAST